MLEFLVPVVAFIGFLVGAILAAVSPEEMKPGRAYFIWLVRVISLSIIVAMFYFSGFNILGLLFGIVFGLFVREYFFALGLAVAMSVLVSRNAFFLLSALTFVFGVVYGTVIKSSGKLTFTNLFTKITFFFLPFLVLFFDVPPKLFLQFAAGAFLVMFTIKSLPKKI